MVVIAITAMLCGLLAQHLGLTENVAKIITKIAKCPKCTCFWFTLLVLLYCSYNPLIAFSLSLLSAYTSIWLGVVLMWLNAKYNKLWERLNK